MAIIAVTIAIYVPSLGGEAVWDDHDLITGKGIPEVSTLADCFTHPFLFNYYRPLTSASILLDRHLWHQNPFGFHLTNLLLHVLATAALMGLLATAFRDRRIALLGGLVFAVQPAQVGATAWIGGRTDALSVLWVILFAWATIAAARHESRRVLFLGLAIAAYATAIFTKEQSLPLLLLVVPALRWFAPDDRPRAHWAWTVPFIFAAAGFAAANMLVALPVTPAYTGGHLAHFGHVMRSLLYYGLELVAPTHRWLNTVSLTAFQNAGVLSAIAGFAFVLCTAWLLVRFVRTDRIAAWFLLLAILAIAPVSNIVFLSGLPVAPYRSSIAGIGIAGILAIGFVKLISAARESASNRRTFGILCVSGYVCWLVFVSVQGVITWRNELGASKTALVYNADSDFAQLVLASAELDRNNLIRGAAHLDRVAGIGALPTSEARMISGSREHGDYDKWLTRLYAKLGFALIKANDGEHAEMAFERGHKVIPTDAYINLGIAALAHARGDWRLELRHLRLTVASKPDMSQQRLGLANLLIARGRFSEAQAELRTCIFHSPRYPDAYKALAAIQRRLGDTASADSTTAAAYRNGALPGANGLPERLALARERSR